MYRSVQLETSVEATDDLILKLMNPQHNLESVSQETELILGAVTSIMVFVDLNLNVVRWNAQAESIFGLESRGVVGKPLLDLKILWDCGTVSKALLECAQCQTQVRVEDLILDSLGGSSRVLGLTLSPILVDGCSTGILIQGADITDKRAAERLAREEGRRYRSVVENVSDVVFQTDPSGQLTFINHCWGKITGFHESASLGLPLPSFFLPEDMVVHAKAFAEVWRNERQSYRCQLRLPRRNGEIAWTEVFVQKTISEHASLSGASGTITDISERKLTEASNARLRKLKTILATLSAGLICSTAEEADSALLEALDTLADHLECDRSAMYVATAQGDFRLQHEYYRSEKCGLRPHVGLLSPQDLPEFSTQLQELKPFSICLENSEDQDFHSRYPWLAKTGIKSKVVLPLYRDQQLQGFLTFGFSESEKKWTSEFNALFRVVSSMVSNVLQRIESEHTLKLVNERAVADYKSMLSAAVAAAPLILFCMDKDGVFTLSEGRGLAALDLQPGQLVGRSGFEIYGHFLGYEDQLRRALRGEEFAIETALGLVTFETHFMPIRDADGNLDGVMGISIDVTDRLQADLAVKLRARAFTDCRHGIVITDPSLPDNPIIYANEMFFQMTGYTQSEVYGRNCRFLRRGNEDEEAVNVVRNAIRTGSECTVVLRNYRKNGELFYNELTLYPMREGGEITHYVGIQYDITEHRTLETQLSHAQKMESVGLLAAGIAHEINTPMQYIGDNSRFLRSAFRDVLGWLSQPENRPLESDEDAQYLLAEIPLAIEQSLEGIERVSNIVNALKEFSHPGTNEFVAVDINRSIQSTVTVARNEWKYVAEVEYDLLEELPKVSCLPGDFNQVMLNLIVNASHAIADRIGKGDYERGLIRIATSTEGDVLVVSVQDNGAGIPDSAKAKVFDPFFTTKEVGKGTGQGLSICESIIREKHHGSIKFSTNLGEGTTFTLRIPISRNDNLIERPSAA